MRTMTIFEPNSNKQRLLQTAITIEPDIAKKVVSYMNQCEITSLSSILLADLLSGDTQTLHVVPTNTRTDGYFMWDDAVMYYLGKYYLTPSIQFIRHCRTLDFIPPSIADLSPKHRDNFN